MSDFGQSDVLSLLASAPAQTVKDQAELALERLGEVTVIQNRTGLVMLPYTDTAQGTRFHLGEVLVSESHIRLPDGTEGYGTCLGRDLEQSMAIAVLDAAWQAGLSDAGFNDWLTVQRTAQTSDDDALLRMVEATRIELETF